MSFLSKIINFYIALISITIIISSSDTNTTLVYCDINKYCGQCTLCGNETNDYTPCSFYNLFCTQSSTNYTIYQNDNLQKYSEYFRNIPNANEFCGQATYSFNKLIDSFSIMNKTSIEIKNSNINHCNYEIYNSKYFYNYVDVLYLKIRLKTNISKKNNLKLTLNILRHDSRSGTGKHKIINEDDLINEEYQLILNTYDDIIILLDIFINGEIDQNIDEYLEIEIDTDNQSIQNNKLIKILIIVIVCILVILIAVLIIFVIYQRKKMREIIRIRNETLQQEELKRKQEEERINKILEKILIPKEFNEKEVTNDCTECTICIEKFVAKCLICITPCKHSFHYECLKKYVETAKEKQKLIIKCPLCNYDFLEEKNDEKKFNEVNNNENNTQQNNNEIIPQVINIRSSARAVSSEERLRENNRDAD